MVIERSHKIYGADLQPIAFNTPAARSRYNGSDLNSLRAGGYDWYVYAPPTVADPYAQKLDGVKAIDGVTVTEGLIALTQPEIDAKLVELDVQLTHGIDVAADAPRVGLVSPGSLVDQEYLMAYNDALAYQAAGNIGPVPAGVQSWADAKGWTAEVAAKDITDTQAAWYGAAMAIREIRLAGKEAVRNAATAANKQVAFDATIAQFDALPF